MAARVSTGVTSGMPCRRLLWVSAAEVLQHNSAIRAIFSPLFLLCFSFGLIPERRGVACAEQGFSLALAAS
jgi:hypothetical protein